MLTASLDYFPAGAILHQQTRADNAHDELMLSTIESLADKVARNALKSAHCRIGKRAGQNLFSIDCRRKRH
jgi:hypothetical protein